MADDVTPRLTIRTAFGAVLCVLGVVGVSCSSGSNCATGPTTTTTSTLTSDLATDYFLSYVTSSTGQFRNIPVKYQDSASYQLRVWSDSLSLGLTDTSYVEHGRTGRYDPVSGDELLRNFKSASRKFTISGSTNLSFPAFLGGAGTAVRVPNYNKALIRITASADSSIWYFYPKF